MHLYYTMIVQTNQNSETGLGIAISKNMMLGRHRSDSKAMNVESSDFWKCMRQLRTSFCSKSNVQTGFGLIFCKCPFWGVGLFWMEFAQIGGNTHPSWHT